MHFIDHTFIWTEGERLNRGFAAQFTVAIGYSIRNGKPVAEEVAVEINRNGKGKHQINEFVPARDDLTARVLRFANGSNATAGKLREKVLEDAGMYSEHEYAAERLGHREYGLTERAV